jgi:hypothetical protein
VRVNDLISSLLLDLTGVYRNQLIMADGSYGGVYLARIGSAINNHNKALVGVDDEYSQDFGNIRVNLESIVLHNPIFVSPFLVSWCRVKCTTDNDVFFMQNVLAHYQWLMYYRCFLHQVHNVTTCQQITGAQNLHSFLHSIRTRYLQLRVGYLGPCLESIELSYQVPSNVNQSVEATNLCLVDFGGQSTNGILLEDIRKRVSTLLGVFLECDKDGHSAIVMTFLSVIPNMDGQTTCSMDLLESECLIRPMASTLWD